MVATLLFCHPTLYKTGMTNKRDWKRNEQILNINKSPETQYKVILSSEVSSTTTWPTVLIWFPLHNICAWKHWCNIHGWISAGVIQHSLDYETSTGLKVKLEKLLWFCSWYLETVIRRKPEDDSPYEQDSQSLEEQKVKKRRWKLKETFSQMIKDCGWTGMTRDGWFSQGVNWGDWLLEKNCYRSYLISYQSIVSPWKAISSRDWGHFLGKFGNNFICLL